MYYYYVWSRVYYYILDSHARHRESPLFTRYISGKKPSVCCVYLKCPIHETSVSQMSYSLRCTRYISGKKPSVCCVYLVNRTFEIHLWAFACISNVLFTRHIAKAPLSCIVKVPYFVSKKSPILYVSLVQKRTSEMCCI